MDPILQKLSRENPNVNLLKIDADSNITITEKFEVEESNFSMIYPIV